jgi:hypothetical protein
MGIFNSDNSIQAKLEDLNSAILQFIRSTSNQNWNKINNKYESLKNYVIKNNYKFSHEEFKKIEKTVKMHKKELPYVAFLDEYLNFIKQNIQNNGVKNRYNQNQNANTYISQNNNQPYSQMYQSNYENGKGKQFSQNNSNPYNSRRNKNIYNTFEDMEQDNYLSNPQDYGMSNSQSSQEQLSMKVNKQEVMQIQDQNHSHNIMGRILSYAENYANFNQPDKNFKRKYKYYDSFNASEKMLINNYRNTFILQIILFNSSYNNYVKNYGVYNYSENLPKANIIKEIQQMKKKLIDHKKDDKLYDSIIDIINNKPININLFQNEINEMKNDGHHGKCNPKIIMSNVPQIKNNIDDLDDKIEEEYLNNPNYRPTMKLNKKLPDMEYIEGASYNNMQFRNLNEERFNKEQMDIDDFDPK